VQLPIGKYDLKFRLVEESDAPFIISLRTHPLMGKYLSATDASLENQVAWIRGYKQREQQGKEYYFIFTGEREEQLGVMRLYDINGTEATYGSWLIKPGCDEFVAIKTDLFIMEFAKELGIETTLFDVRKENKKVIRFHKIFSTQIKEDDLNIYMMMDKAAVQRKIEFLTSLI
jgi:hypothetical protein